MEGIIRRHLPVVVFAALALVIAIVGVAFGGSNATTPKIVKKIAAHQVNKLAPGLSVAHANTAGTAAAASQADDAAKVGGGQICSGTVTLQDNEERSCGTSPIFVRARCIIGTTFAEIDLHVVSETVAAWAYGQSIDDAATLTPLNESPLDNTDILLAQASDNTASPALFQGSGAWVSAGEPGGHSVNGEFSVRANRTGTDQGNCQVSSGGIAR